MLLTALALIPSLILPSDDRIVCVGRFDRRDPAAFACQWPASEIRLRVKGPTLRATIEEKGADVWAVMIDGAFQAPLTLKPGADSYTFDLGKEGEHEVRFIKRTESFVGTTTFHGFETPGGDLLRAVPKRRRLEFVGDSITCGYGNEGASQTERFRPGTENAAMTYASLTAREVDADVTVLAWSGRKMWPDNTMPEIYDRILPTEAEPIFDFKAPAPDAVVIHLATNDFGQKNPEEAGWTDAYEAFIKRVRGHYPKAQIYAAIGSMMSDSYPPENKALSTVRDYLTIMIARINDPRLHFIEFDVQKMNDGIGSDWHPNLRTHQKMATRLTEAIRKDLKW